jgi:hypothetical protein
MPTFLSVVLLFATWIVFITLPCYIRARGLGAPAFRLFEFKNGIGVVPLLVNGLDYVCTCAAPGYHTENLLLQVWASLYRLMERIKNCGISIIQGQAVRPCGAGRQNRCAVSPPLLPAFGFTRSRLFHFVSWKMHDDLEQNNHARMRDSGSFMRGDTG